MRNKQRMTTCLALMLLSVITPARAADADPAIDPQLAPTYPTVLTPTRLRQSQADVPAAITVLTASTLERFGVANLIDALRLVPGMAVTETTGNDIRISYHGTNLNAPRRMNVLVDGVSLYRPGLARVNWRTMPVPFDAIDRIEVTRGTNSAAYGPNSLLATVNIITRHPNDAPAFSAALRAGTGDAQSVTLGGAGRIAGTSVRATVNYERDDGYDFISNATAPHDSMRLARVNLRSSTEVTARSTLDLTAAGSAGTSEVPFADAGQRTFPDIEFRDYYLGATWTTAVSDTQEFKLRASFSSTKVTQSWQTCIPALLFLPEMFAMWRANPAYANAIARGQIPTGGTPQDNLLALQAIAAINALGAQALQPLCSTPNQNLLEERTDIEAQHTYVISPELRLLLGVGARRDVGDSITFLGGRIDRNSFRVFGTAEYQPARFARINLGGYYENDEITSSSFSPRIALNVDLSPYQTVRALVSRGTRTPDIFEQNANWTFSVSDLTPPLRGSSQARFYQSAQGTGSLRSERITNRELGYLVNAPRLGLISDLKVFDDTLTELISDRLNLASFHPSNSGRLGLRGAEWQVTAALTERWGLLAHYAYLDQRDNPAPTERTQYSRHSGAAGVSYVEAGWRGSLVYYGSSGDGIGQSSYNRIDANAARTFRVGATRLTAGLTVSQLAGDTTSYTDTTNRILINRYDESTRVFAYLRVDL